MKVYFDYNATAPIPSEVKAIFVDLLDEPGNASSIHQFGRNSKRMLEEARHTLKELLGADDQYELIFTSSGTEANNLALCGLKDFKVITTPIEHVSVLKVAEGIIPVDENGVVIIEQFEKLIKTYKQKVLVSVIAANNETGVIQPIAELAKIVHYYGGIFHTDASQIIGKLPFSMEGIDMATISGHKFGSAMGAAALVLNKKLDLRPLMRGGGQEYRLRPGTQNVPAIYSMKVAAEIAINNLSNFKSIAKLRDHLESSLKKISLSSIIFSSKADRLPNTTNISMPYVDSQTQVIHFDIKNFAVSAGSACSSGKVDIPYVQLAMGFSENIAKTALRISLGLANTMHEINLFIEAWKELYYNSNQCKEAI